MPFSFFVGHVFHFKQAQIQFKISLFPLSNESQILLNDYSKTTNSTASLVAAISKKNIYNAMLESITKFNL